MAQVLVAADAISDEVFILQRGSLRLSGGVAAGAGCHSGFKRQRERACETKSTGRASAAQANPRHSQRVSKSARSLALPVSLPGAETSRFLLLERAGALAGSLNAAASPFIIDALKLSHVLVLDGPSVLRQLPAPEAAAVRASVRAQQQRHIDFLALGRRVSAADASDADVAHVVAGDAATRVSRWVKRALPSTDTAADGADEASAAPAGDDSEAHTDKAASATTTARLHDHMACMRELATDAGASLLQAAEQLRAHRRMAPPDASEIDSEIETLMQEVEQQMVE